ncbi:MAG: RICIN domain-containing protein [Muribaculaceae bacterium]|nr:RICIN domain-containing protein [Muribaculaceae bacterium]
MVTYANVASADCGLGVRIKEGYYVISSTVNQNFCVDVKMGVAAEKTNIQIHHANGTKAQKWYFEYAGDDSYYIRSALDRNLVLAIKNDAAIEGGNIQLARFNGSEAQRWYLQKIAKDEYHIRSYIDYMLVLDFSGRPADRVNIKLSDFFKNGDKDSIIWKIHK